MGIGERGIVGLLIDLEGISVNVLTATNNFIAYFFSNAKMSGIFFKLVAKLTLLLIKINWVNTQVFIRRSLQMNVK